jgi:hypothetical protein
MYLATDGNLFQEKVKPMKIVKTKVFMKIIKMFPLLFMYHAVALDTNDPLINRQNHKSID